MTFSPKIPAVVLLSGVLLLSGCIRGNLNKNVAPASTGNTGDNSGVARDDVLELGKLINFPFEPGESTVWRETDAKTADEPNKSASKNGKTLVAVLQFEAGQLNEIINRAESHGAAMPAEIDAESWFPAELIAQSQVSGNGTLKGNSYAANDFVKAPYIDGKLTRIVNSNYFVLELTAQ